MWYRIDFVKFVFQLLPPVFRRKVLFAWLSVIVLPFRDIYNRFTVYRETVTKRLDMSGNVQYLERVLNGEFYLSNGEIYITDIAESLLCTYLKKENQLPLYVHGKSEAQAEKMYVRKNGEGKYSGDFAVNVPSFLDTPEHLSRISLLLNYYKPAGRKYIIKVYQYE